MKRKTIAVDLDGTLAFYDKYRGPTTIGEPVKPMVDRVRRWLGEGHKVIIFTARVDAGNGYRQRSPYIKLSREELRAQIVKAIEDWCLEHLGEKLEITNQKDHRMSEFWDDRAVAVERNTGKILSAVQVKAAFRRGRAVGYMKGKALCPR